MLSAGASLAKTGRSSQSTHWCESLAVPTAAPTGMPGPPQLQHRALGSPLAGSVPGGLHFQLAGGCSVWQSRSLCTPSPGVPTCASLSVPWQRAPGWGIPRSALAGGREPGHCSLPPRAVGPRHLGPGPAALLLHMFQLLSEAASAPGRCCNRRARLCRLLAVALV